MRRFLRENGLTLAFFALFWLVLVGQVFAGLADHNRQLAADGLLPVTLITFVTSSDFAVDVAENWQSEYLQFSLFILLVVFLTQRGSPESKPVADAGTESDRQQFIGTHAQPDSPRWAKAGGWRAGLYGWSLGLLMVALFLGSWVAQALTGVVVHNGERFRNLQDPLSLPEYVASPDFWNRTLQNWQSEMLAVACMAVFTIYLRQRGSSESKPVGAPHDAIKV